MQYRKDRYGRTNFFAGIWLYEIYKNGNSIDLDKTRREFDACH